MALWLGWAFCSRKSDLLLAIWLGALSTNKVPAALG